MTLTVWGGGGGGSLNKNTAIVNGPGSAFAVHVLFQGFPSGDGWGHPLCLFFVYKQCGPRSGPTDPNCLKL